MFDLMFHLELLVIQVNNLEWLMIYLIHIHSTNDSFLKYMYEELQIHKRKIDQDISHHKGIIFEQALQKIEYQNSQ